MNKVEITPEMEAACATAKAALGGPVALAKALSETGKAITSQAVGKWRAVPPEWVLEVERLTEVSRHDLRPDVFGFALTAERFDEAFPGRKPAGAVA